MNKEFIPYEQALELKELGFDEPCLAWYAEDKNLQIAPDVYKKWTSNPCDNSNIIIVFNLDCITAPTYSQALRWFRDKYSILLYKDYGKVPHMTIIQNLMFEYGLLSYEEAELACLKKLIEIVKNK